MSTTIDERVVGMKFDNSDFEKNVKTSMDSLGKLKKSLDSAESAKGFENLGKAANGIKLDGLVSTVENIGNRFTTLGIIGVTALQNITNAAINTGTALIKSLSVDQIRGGFQEYELKMGSIQTIMAGTGESLDRVNQKLDELNTYADRTIYSFSDMTNNIGKFTNAGVKLDDAVAAIQGVANVAAVSGSNAEQASHAMYNFAQALSAGYVKLIDWKSIENANMATVEFKQQLIDTALELGTLTKSGDDYITTTTNMKGKVSDAFNATQMFNDSLSFQWMTTEVLTKTLGKYSDETTDIGKKAFAAAQDVKTFTQLMDTLKEAVGSGWAMTFQLIVGDFDQAKKLWTDVNNIIGEVIDRSSNLRNDFLKGVLGNSSSKFKDYLQDVFGDNDKLNVYDTIAQDIGKAITKRTKDHDWDAWSDELKGLENQYGDLIKAVESGELTLSDFNDGILYSIEQIDKMVQQEYDPKKFTNLVDYDEWVNWQKERLSVLKNVYSEVNKEGTDLNKLFSNFQRKSGRELLTETLLNTLKAIVDLSGVVKTAWNSVFPPATTEQLYNIVKSVNEFSQKIQLSQTRIRDLSTILRGAFSALDILKKMFLAVAREVKPFIQVFTNSTGGLKNMLLEIARMFIDINKNISNFSSLSEIFESIGKHAAEAIPKIFKIGVELAKGLFNGIMSAFKPMLDKVMGMVISIIPEPLKNFVEGFVGAITNAIPVVIEKFNSLKTSLSNLFSGRSLSSMDGFGRVLGTIKDNFKQTSDNAKEFVANVKGAIDSLTANDAFQMFLGILNAVWEITKGLASFLGSVVLDVLNAVANAVGKIDFNTLLNLFNAGVMTDLIIQLKNVLDPFGDLGDMIENLREDFGALQGMLKAFTTNINADSLLKIAGAVGILALSLLTLSSLDTEALTKSLGAVSVLIIELTSALGILTKSFSTKTTGFKGFMSSISGMFDAAKLKVAASSMVSLAEALLIMAVAVRVLGSMDLDDLAKGLGAVSILLAEIGVFLTATNKFGKIDNKSSTAMILIAASLNVMASAVKKMGELEIGTLVKGLGAVSLLLTEIGAFMAASRYFGKVGISSALAMVIIAESLKIFAKDIALFAQYEWGDLGKAGVAIGGLLAILGTFSELAGGAKFLATSVGLTIVGAALMIFANAMTTLSAVSFGDILKNFVALSLALGLLAAGAAIAESLSKGFLVLAATMIGISTGVLIFASAMNVLVPALQAFGNMRWEQIAKAGVVLGGLVVILGLFSELAGGAKFLATSVGLIIVAKALEMFGSAMITLSQLSFGEIIKNFVTLSLALGLLTAGAAIATVLAPGMLVLAGALLAIGAATALAGIGLATLGAGFAALSTLGVAGATALVASLAVIVEGVAKLIPDICRAIVEGMGAFATAIVECAPIIFEAATVIISGILDILINLSPKILELLSVLFSGMIQFVTEKIPEIVGVFKVILDEIINAFTEYVPKIINAAKDIVLSVINSFADAIPEFVDAGVSLVDAFLTGLASMGVGIAEAAFNMVITFIDGLASVIEEKTPEIVKVTKRLLDVIFTAMETIFKGNEKLKEFGKTFVDSLIGGFKSEIEESSKTVIDLLNGMITSVSTTATKLKELGSLLITNIVEGMKAMTTNALQYMKTVMDKLYSTGKPFESTFLNLGKSLINSLSSGMDQISSKANNTLLQLMKNMVSSIRGYRDSFYSSGQYVVDGLVRGIESKASSATNAIRNLGNSIYNAFNKSVKINSPSKLFAESGMYLDLGIVKGVNQYARLATNAMADLGSDVVSAFNGSYSGISNVIEDTNLNPRMRPVLDMSEASRGANSMNNLFSDKRLELLDTIALNSPDTAYQNDVIRTMNRLRADVSYLGDQMSHFKMVLDSGTIIGELTPGIDEALGMRATLAGRGI